jgi:hypothetical protein
MTDGDRKKAKENVFINNLALVYNLTWFILLSCSVITIILSFQLQFPISIIIGSLNPILKPEWDYFIINAHRAFFREMSANTLTDGCRKLILFIGNCLSC